MDVNPRHSELPVFGQGQPVLFYPVVLGTQRLGILPLPTPRLLGSDGLRQCRCRDGLGAQPKARVSGNIA